MFDTKIFFNDKIIYFLSDSDKKISAPATKIKISEAKDLEYYLLIAPPQEQEIYFFNPYLSILKEAIDDFFAYINAAGGVVENAENKILIIRRWGIWDLPKGKVEPNEKIKIAALREVEEETSVKQLELKEKICDTFHIYFRNSIPYLKKTYWFRMFTQSTEILRPQYDEDITQALWFDKRNLNEVYQNTYPSIIKVLDTFKELK